MNDYKIDDDLINEVRDQFRIWALFLNNGIGLLAFTFGLACLGTTTPWISGSFSLIMITLIRWQGKRYFPSRINKLRREAKTNRKAKILLNGLESKFLGIKSLFLEYPIFLFGFFFLSVITFGSFITSSIITKIFSTLGIYFSI